MKAFAIISAKSTCASIASSITTIVVSTIRSYWTEAASFWVSWYSPSYGPPFGRHPNSFPQHRFHSECTTHTRAYLVLTGKTWLHCHTHRCCLPLTSLHCLLPLVLELLVYCCAGGTVLILNLTTNLIVEMTEAAIASLTMTVWTAAISLSGEPSASLQSPWLSDHFYPSAVEKSHSHSRRHCHR